MGIGTCTGTTRAVSGEKKILYRDKTGTTPQMKSPCFLYHNSLTHFTFLQKTSIHFVVQKINSKI